MTFSPNGYRLLDMAGIVWEWRSEWYRPDYYSQFEKIGFMSDPQVPVNSVDPDEHTVAKRVVRRGSFLCADQYCSGFRVAARMKTSPVTSLENTGFLCVVSAM